MVDLEDIVVRAVQSTATFVVVVLVGAFLANYPKAPNQVRAQQAQGTRSVKHSSLSRNARH